MKSSVEAAIRTSAQPGEVLLPLPARHLHSGPAECGGPAARGVPQRHVLVVTDGRLAR